MTPTQQKAMEMALEALRYGGAASAGRVNRAIKALRAALAEQADDKAVRYGCHCDLEPHMEPDGCVLDDGRPWDCVYAQRPGATKEGCEYWKPIVVAARSKT